MEQKARLNADGIQDLARRFLITIAFRVLEILCLAIALFGGDLSIALDLPDDPANVIIDIIMTLVTLFFIAEVMLRCAAEPRVYPLSGFFFMDIIGTASMMFEMSWLLGEAGRIEEADAHINGVLLRGARAARLGVRVGRLTKLIKCMSALNRRYLAQEPKGPGQQAKVLNCRLMHVLSTKVSILTVVLVLGIPLFNIGQFPHTDLSMRAWGRRLEAAFVREYAAAKDGQQVDGSFRVVVEDMLLFYDDVQYHPYQLDGFGETFTIDGMDVRIPGANLLDGTTPNRDQNVLKQPVKCLVEREGCEGDDQAAIYFNLTGAKRYNAAMDIALIIFVVLTMGIQAWDLSQTLQRIVVKPIEKMLDTVYVMKRTLHQVLSMDELEDGKTNVSTSMGTMENDVVGRVLQKLARLIEVFMEDDLISKDVVGMDPESRGVIVEIMQQAQKQASVPCKKGRGSIAPVKEPVVEELPVDLAIINSWELDVLSLASNDQDKLVCHLLFDSDVGQTTGSVWTDIGTMMNFAQGVKAEYLDNPYHCYAHACDVLASLVRILRQVRWRHFLSDVDMYALLISAVCHDVAHPGKTNPFLVEMGDELALRYNDRSPLENMHCARLFEICREPGRDILSSLSRNAYKQARAVCITSILHTDNAHHFDLVKELKRAYEVSLATCDAQAQDPDSLNEAYVAEVLCKNTVLWHKLFLHLADVSNPLKPFWVYMLWATRVTDEFFAQGDEEKRLGIPVGMLNDRDKVSRPGSEHGFITFLVAPLMSSAVGLFPPLQPLAGQMVSNLGAWRNLWVQQSNPSTEDIKKRDADVQKIREQVESLNRASSKELN